MSQKLPDHYSLKSSDADKTGIRLFGLTDSQTGITTNFAEFNKDFDVHATIAWAGARTSRSADLYEDIFAEIKEAYDDEKYSAGEKLAKVFVGYGHASVADMSPAMLYINNIPMHLTFWIFNHTSVGAGQELSTRYVEIGDFKIRPLTEIVSDENVADETIESLNQKWENLQSLSATLYKKWYDKLYKALESYLQENTDENLSKSTLVARTLDVVRFFLPMGSATSMTLLTSTRNWIDLVVQLRSAHDLRYNQLGDQINTLLNLKDFEECKDIQADLGGLTKYSEGKDTISKNLESIRSQIEQHVDLANAAETDSEVTFNSVERIQSEDLHSGLGIALQYISVLFPQLGEEEIVALLQKLSNENKAKIGEAILREHNHHNLLRNAGDIRGDLFVLKTAAAYARDLNRHRAFGRLVHMFETDDLDGILAGGYNKNFQLHHAEYWTEFADEFEKDMDGYYEKLHELFSDMKQNLDEKYHRLIIDMLPLGHQIKMHMSGPTAQLNYMTSLRISLGGDYGYRDLVYKFLEILRKDPFLSSMLSHLDKPDPNDIEQLLGRS